MYKIEQIEALLFKLESLKKSAEGFIYEYFENIKADVYLRRERLKQEIDQCSDAVTEEIEKAKSECMKTSTQIGDVSTKLDSFSYELNELKDHFSSLETSEGESQNKRVKLDLNVDERFQKYQYFLLGNKTCSFEFDKLLIF